MEKNKESTIIYPSYSLASANFISSLGGGLILGNAMGLLKNIPFLRGDSLLAYLLGTTLGLFILRVFGKDKLLNGFTKYSTLSGITSIILLILLFFYQEVIVKGSNLSFIFFVMLVLRFGFWFLARIARVDIAAGVNKNLAWTEFSYYLGAIIGLLGWQSFWTTLTVIQLLYIDIIAQTVAALLDNFSFQKLKIFLNDSINPISKAKIPLNFFIGVTGFIVCITVATQIVEFGFATFSIEFFEDGKNFAAHIVAAGYVGAAFGAWYLGKIDLDYSHTKILGIGSIKSSRHSFPLIYTCLICLILLSLAFIVAFQAWSFSKSISLILFALSALVYDLIVLVLLNELGKEAKKVGDVGSVGSVYAYMGAIGSLCMFIFVQVLEKKYSFIFASIIFFSLGYLFLIFFHKQHQNIEDINA